MQEQTWDGSRRRELSSTPTAGHGMYIVVAATSTHVHGNRLNRGMTCRRRLGMYRIRTVFWPARRTLFGPKFGMVVWIASMFKVRFVCGLMLFLLVFGWEVGVGLGLELGLELGLGMRVGMGVWYGHG
jgi:hypothetical protein